MFLEIVCFTLSNIREISVACLPKIGSSTDSNKETLEVEMEQILRGQLKALEV